EHRAELLSRHAIERELDLWPPLNRERDARVLAVRAGERQPFARVGQPCPRLDLAGLEAERVVGWDRVPVDVLRARAEDDRVSGFGLRGEVQIQAPVAVDDRLPFQA